MVPLNAIKTQQISPNDDVGNGRKTLQDIMGIIEGHGDLRERRRREILSALRRVAHLIGRHPAEIIALPTSGLQRQLKEVNYQQAGIEKRRWINMRSLTLTALRLSGASIMPSRWQRSIYSQNWLVLRSRCSSAYLIGLSRFMNFCSFRKIEPDQVCSTVFEEFRRHLETLSIVRHPDRVYRSTCRIWDQASNSIEGWPAHRVGVKSDSRSYALAWDAFPISFRDDVNAFLSFGGNRDIFADDYARSVKPATTMFRQSSIRQMATALAQSGVPIETITGLASLVEPQHAKSILTFFINRVGGKPKDSTYTLACLLRTIARSWVKKSENLQKLDQFCRAIGRECIKKRGMKDRNRRRLQQFDNERNVTALLNLPRKLFQVARQQDIGGEWAPKFSMYGVAIEILTVSAIRIKNLVSLKVGHNIVLPLDKEHGRVRLWIPDEEMKNGSPVDMLLPPSSSQLIMQYLEEVRPRISQAASDWFFPNFGGKQRNIGGFSTQISTLIKRHTGLDMNVHLFRHLALKILEQDDPNSAEVGRRLLSHRSIQTTLNAYSEGKSQAAHEHFENLIDAKRSGHRQSDGRKGRNHESPRS